MATIAQLQTRQQQIETAIEAILNGGQEYKINDGLIDNWMRRGDLDTLYRELAKIEKRIARLEDSGGFIGI